MHPAVAAYEAAYESGDPHQVAAHVSSAFSVDGALVSPWLAGPVVRHDAITTHVLRTRERLAGTSARHTSAVERVGDMLRWTWAFEQDGAIVTEGMDVAVLAADGRMTLLVVFDGAAPPPIC